jgi:dTDP-4-amino-4,6-dideoxygalactose transaminase
VFEGLRAAGIGVNVHYIPVYRQPYYRAHGFQDVALPGAETYYGECISLPMFPGLTDDEARGVVSTVASLLETHG